MRFLNHPWHLVLALAAGVASSQASTWNEVGPAPVARVEHAMVYDSAHGVVVLFSGSDGVSDTWEWDGNSWSLRSSTGPSGRYGHAMAYDSARGRLVLFGGYNGSIIGDTWEWDGTSWSQMTPLNSPSARMEHAMAYDSARGRVVMFGGSSGSSALGDTWEWDGGNWMHMSPTINPPLRQRHAMAYDSAGARVVLFGGFSASSATLGDTWEWDGTNWSQRSATGAPARYEHAMAYDPAHGVILFGGSAGVSHFGDTWGWNGARWTQIFPATSPGLADAHAMAYDSSRGRIVLFGKMSTNSGLNRQTWEWDGTNWNLRISGPQRPSGSNVMAYDSARHVVVLFGGFQTWEWDGTTWTLRSEAGPADAFGHAMTYDSARRRILLMGQESGHWEWDGNFWRQGSGGGFYEGTAMVYDSRRGVVVAFGGYDTFLHTYLNYTWEWDGANQTVTTSGPSGRSEHAMVYDSARGVVVLFGGINDSGALSDTWEWNGSFWLRRNVPGPQARRGHAMAYGGSTVLFGGISSGGNSLSDTWEWDGTTWTQQASFPAPPGSFEEFGMAFDSARGRVVLSSSAETWEYDKCPIWFSDADGDGYGDPANTLSSCGQPMDFVATSGDCDDADPTIHPGAPEINDGLDNQCYGDQGYGVIDEVSGIVELGPGNICWDAQSGATSYQVVRSDRPDFSAGCAAATVTTTCFDDPFLPPAGQVYFYLIRALTPHVGSWGQNSNGTERSGGCLPP